ncbi:TPA: hypothetical protein ACIAIE_005626 [Serratia fonticola]
MSETLFLATLITFRKNRISETAIFARVKECLQSFMTIYLLKTYSE